MATKITVTPTTKAEIAEDIFTPGNLVHSNVRIVLVTSPDGLYETSFSGLSLSGVTDKEHCDDWTKSEFKQFKGTVTITAE